MEKTQVMKEFEEICKIPRYSFHNEKILNYCVNWAKENGFKYIFDEENGNVIITRPAAKGMEDKPGIVIQGHLDMVAECDPGVVHDWDNEGVDYYIEDGWYMAKGTTLGADDGVAPAIGFALFKDENLKAPNLELLLSTDEEVGMLSVKNADLKFLKGKYLLNIDSGPEGMFTVGCCGGKLLKAIVPDVREKAQGNIFEVAVSGLTGGHSGMEITNEKGNAIKILGDVLYRIALEGKVRISSVNAEGKDNAISTNAKCVFATDLESAQVEKIIASSCSDHKKMLRLTDPGVMIKVCCSACEDMLCSRESDSLAFLLQNLPYGVLHFEQDLKCVETSCNLGLIEKDEKGIGIYVSLRSSVAERIEQETAKVRSLCKMAGAVCEDQEKNYPAWQADYDSPFLKKAMELYKEFSGKEPEVFTTHGGLECGYILQNSNIHSIVAIGPDSEGEHTPREKLSVSSLNRTYEFVKRILENPCE